MFPRRGFKGTEVPQRRPQTLSRHGIQRSTCTERIGFWRKSVEKYCVGGSLSWDKHRREHAARLPLFLCVLPTSPRVTAYDVQ